jgi:hypothetical protein
MVILRRTRKLARALPATAKAPDPSDTALCDWYVNRLVVDRKPLLILVSSTSLLPILISARDVASLPARLPALVRARLDRLGVSRPVIDAEMGAMQLVVTADTSNRSVTGVMVDFAQMVPYHLYAGRWNDDSLPHVESRLARTPCFAGKPADQVIFPDQAAPRLLAKRWRGEAVGTGFQ